CFNVGIPGAGVNREYSMYSGADEPYLEFLIRKQEDGIVSPYLAELRKGDFIEIDGPYGEFCLKNTVRPEQHYLFLATGTGIAPFHSFVKTYSELNYTIIHGIRYPEEQYQYADYKDGNCISCISKNIVGKTSYRLTDYIMKNPVAPESIVYLCGNRNMIIDAFEILRAQHVPGDNIYTEVFF
ncbi:MAG: FAD-binding oxidoreductase, partial [Gammaproteobacteria bacterium]|nr:FAD-binding oxidoreductase [Gammaproteobacteria bacterium]